MDIDTIHAGEPFAVRIEEALANCAACVVVIGRVWESITAPDGSRRLDDPTDFVRLEVAGALRSGARVFPVLVDGGSMPAAGSLPEDIRDLAGLQAIQLRGDSWNYDVGRLMLALDQALGTTDGTDAQDGAGSSDATGSVGGTGTKRLSAMAIGVIVAIAIVIVGGIAFVATRSKGTTTSTLPSTSASTSPSSSVSTSETCSRLTPPVTSADSPYRLNGVYGVRMTLTCFHGPLGSNDLWGNPDPKVGEKDWEDNLWRFAQDCAGSCGVTWTVFGRDHFVGDLSSTGTTYIGSSDGKSHCGVDPGATVTRQLQLTVSQSDGSGLVSGFDGWMTISWTCEGHPPVFAKFELGGTLRSS
jgi:hypothetical protein